jgi:choline dehydrogenase
VSSTEFDYLIVGAGSAGCALAARLAEDGRTRVGLIEAGGADRSPFIHVPAGIVRLIGNPRYDWAHLAEPDPSRNGKVDLWPAGKVLGGSSSINGMLFVRGAPADFDRWAAMGNPGWAYADVLPAFRRMETAAFASGQGRGALGPLHVEKLRSRHPLGAAFEAAAEAAGLPRNPDYNDGRQEGVAEPQVTQRRGARWSAARAYLRHRPPNLTILADTHVRRVVFDGARTTGVEIGAPGEPPRTLRAAREVILSAGAIGSPKLLMLSGIGPAAHLVELGIAVRRDAPVGDGLAELPNANMSWDVRPRTYNVEVNGWRAPLHGLSWLVRRRGPATSPYPHAVAFLRGTAQSPEPDIQLMFGPFAFDFSPAGVVPYRERAVTVVAALNYPRARGRLRLRSAAPADKPLIEHALLSDPEDVARLTAACRFVRCIFQQPALTREVIGERLPGRAVQSDADWDAYLRRTTFLGYHPVGTCAMGPDGVVDHLLRVRGVEGLRVADASIIPHPISGNTNAAAIMIGERAADLIRSGAGARGRLQ